MSDDNWREVFPPEAKMPEGYVGNLTDEHREKLCQIWDAFFGICDKASGKDDLDRSGFAEDWGVEEKKEEKKGALGALSGMNSAVKSSGVKKDDNAKAAAQARTEESNMNALLTKYGSEALRDAFWEMCKRDNPDIVMLRYLRARKWDVNQTIAMMGSTLKWRLDTNLDILVQNGDLQNGKDIPKFVENFEANGKVFSLGTNDQNQPVMYVKFGIHVIWAQPMATTRKFIIAEFEAVRLNLVPPNDKIVLLFDCTGFGPSNLDIINFLYILQCLQSYFPEQLQTLILHKAPWILSQAWLAVRYMLDPFVRAKVQFTSKPEELYNIVPKRHLLKYIGGDVDMDFEFIPPVEGENDLHKDKKQRSRRWDNHRRLCDQYEQVTRRWADSNGAECNEERAILQKKVRLSFLDYEPYHTGKLPHHRNGDFAENNPGVIRWQYPMADGDKIREILGRYESRKSLVRELHEIAIGATVEQAEQHTRDMIEDGTWGHWNSCDDIHFATGTQNGKFTYNDDGGISRMIDPIGLDGPETLEEAQKKGKPSKNVDQIAPSTTAATPIAAAAPVAASPTAAAPVAAAKDRKANGVAPSRIAANRSDSAPREKARPSNQTNGKPQKSLSDYNGVVEKQPQRKSFLGNLKSKIYV